MALNPFIAIEIDGRSTDESPLIIRIRLLAKIVANNCHDSINHGNPGYKKEPIVCQNSSIFLFVFLNGAF